ncbi:MAG TPA: hypothetical protein VHM20_08010, partial [Gammaproteobacteria bacterium]|nr:hypothetical protein [Gammaproteobacteria bacterium]
MKYLFLLTLSLLSVSLRAQLCKKARVGMTSNELIKAVGMPDSTQFLGTDTVVMDTISVWFYGKQQAIVSGGKVDRLIMDPMKETELARQVID